MEELDIYALLPSELSYLVEAAQKYGTKQFVSEIASLSDGEKAELRRVGNVFAAKNHAGLLNQFLDQYPITQFDKSSRLYFLTGIFDELGLQPTQPNSSVAENIKQLEKFGGERLASARAYSARQLGESGIDNDLVIAALETATEDEDERVQIWARYGLAKLGRDSDRNVQMIREIYALHNQVDELGCLDDIGGEAADALELLSDQPPP